MSNTISNQKEFYQSVIYVTESAKLSDDGENLSAILGIDKTQMELKVISHDKVQTISVDQTRNIILESFKKNISGKINVYVFVEADRMKDVAQNSLLKILEEPPTDTLFVLLVENVEKLLVTIRSRSRIIKDKKNQNLQPIVEQDLLEMSDKDFEGKKIKDIISGHYGDQLDTSQDVLELKSLVKKIMTSVDNYKLSRLVLFDMWKRRSL
ncbi:MAG: hypothetical protein WCJ19_01510 [bacterium]